MKKLFGIISIKNERFLKTIANYELDFKDDGYSPKTIRDIIRNDNYQIIGYFKNNLLISYAIFTITDNIDLQRIYTISKYRKHEYATLLIEWIKIRYHKNLFVEVRENNLIAIKFYMKLNFKKVSIRKNYYKDGSNALTFIC